MFLDENSSMLFQNTHLCFQKYRPSFSQNTPLYFEEILKTNQKFFGINFSTDLWRKSKYTPVFWSPPLYFQNTPLYYENTPMYFQNTPLYFSKIHLCTFQNTSLYFQNTALYFPEITPIVQNTPLYFTHFSKIQGFILKYTPVFCEMCTFCRNV